MPHAPLLLPEIGGDEGAPMAGAVAAVDLSGPEVLVIASPHGRATGVYAAPSGDLDAFGPRGLGVAAAPGELAETVAAAWARPVLVEPVDHGVVVPLRLLAPTVPVVAVAFEEGMTAGEAVAEGAALASALSSVPRSVVFVASANLSAGLDDRSPVPSLEGAAEADAHVLAALRDDPARLVDHATEVERAGSCAAAPLAAFGALFAGRRCDVLAYAHPFGVGYAVARAR